MQPGSVLAGRYTLHRPLGSGGMGTVWLASDATLRREVAIKLPHPDLEGLGLVRFQREAQAVARLAHRGIATIYDVSDHDGRPFLVLELLAGRDLRDEIDLQPGGIPAERALGYGAQVAEALAAIHGVGMVHRDIKPHNLRLLPDGTVKILDFGIAHLEDATTTLTRAGRAFGTPAYMSPEQRRGAPVDHRADFYALGVTLRHLITGSLPGRRDALPRAVSGYLDVLCAERPEDRPSDALTVAADLRALGAGTGGMLRGATETFDRPSRWNTRYPEAPDVLVGQVPPPVPPFLWRGAEIGDRPGVCDVLTGPPGSGKTRLAAELARASGRPGVLVWVEASSAEAVASAYAEAARALNLAPAPDAARAFLAWTRSTDDPWLVVLDDVPDPGVLHYLWPTPGSAGRVVVTTRHRGFAGHGRRVTEVGPFTPRQSRAFLAARFAEYNHHEEPASLDALAEDLGRLPLALVRASSHMIENRLDCASYRSDLAAGHMDASLTETLVDSVLRAGTDRALTVMSALCVLDPRGVPAELLEHDENQAAVLRALHAHGVIRYLPDATVPTVEADPLLLRAWRTRLGETQIAAIVSLLATMLVDLWPRSRSHPAEPLLRACAAWLVDHHENALWHARLSPRPIFFLYADEVGRAGDPVRAADLFDRWAERTPHPPARAQFLQKAGYWRSEAAATAPPVPVTPGSARDSAPRPTGSAREDTETRATVSGAWPDAELAEILPELRRALASNHSLAEALGTDFLAAVDGTTGRAMSAKELMARLSEVAQVRAVGDDPDAKAFRHLLSRLEWRLGRNP